MNVNENKFFYFLKEKIEKGIGTFSSSLLPIFQENNLKKEVSLIGSSVFIKFKESYFLLSASHVLDFYFSVENPLFTHANKSKYYLAGRLFKTKININEDIDFAILHLRKNIGKEISKFNIPLESNSFLLNHQLTNLDQYFMSGFPESRFKEKIIKKIVYDAKPANIKFYEKYNINRNNFILYEYKKKRRINEKTPIANGISGSGFFYYDFNSIFDKNPKVFLIGIIIKEINLSNSNYKLHQVIKIDVIIGHLLSISKTFKNHFIKSLK